jgi:hypothetical protein
MFKIVFVVSLVYSISCQEDICSQNEASGFCRAAITKYFYDKTSSQCKQFVYGGCGGNQNRFDTIEECQIKCVKPFQISKCEQNADIGPCRAIIPRYFFNKQTKNCELFMFGGCNGNQNNYEQFQDCMKTCL